MTVTRSHVTRALHLTILLAVVTQLLSSLIMERPLPGDHPDWPFVLHTWAGTAGLAALGSLWIWTLLRSRRETPLWRLVPWVSRRGLAGLERDVLRLARDLRAGRLRLLHLDAIAGAAHGLGLLLATFLAATGALWSFVLQDGPWGHAVLGAHKLAGNLMWAYLVGHFAMAIFHQALGDDVFSRMFWTRRRAGGRTVAAE
jgi:cytochrome b561